MHVLLVSGPEREHKLLVLLDGFEVTHVRGLRDVPTLMRFVGRESVVIVDSLGRYAALALLACLASLSPMVLRVRGEYFREERDRLTGRVGVWRWGRFAANVSLAAVCLRVARLVVFNSAYVAGALRHHRRAGSEVIVHNPYTPPPHVTRGGATGPAGGLRLLTVTNMNLAAKVQPLYVALGEWLPKAVWDDLDIQWIMCGSGMHETAFREFVRERNLASRVHVLGHVAGVAELYQWCDVMVHLTNMDAFPNVVLEAMAQRRPVVTNADSCGTREQVDDGVTGFVAEDGAGLVRALNAYASDEALRRRHGEAGWARLQREFVVDVQRGRLHEALRKLTA
jgi:glycosyltransferase involved in cell wall biosynthesis